MPVISKAFLRITAIVPQKRKTSRVNIYLDGKFAFGLDIAGVVEHSLSSGKVITTAEIEKILKKEEFTKLQDSAIHYLNWRPRSEKEVRDHLSRKIQKAENVKFKDARQSPLIDKIVSKLKKYKLINDREFAKWFVSSRTRSNPKSRRIIALELKGKGIDTQIIDWALTKAGNEKDLAIKSVSKKIKRWQKLEPLELKKKLYQFLLSRGFDYDTVKVVFAYFAKKH